MLLRNLISLCVLGLWVAVSTPAETLPDPTRPPALGVVITDPTPTASQVLPTLQSTFIAPHQRLAIMDGHTVAEGDAVGDARVLRIQSDAVVLLRGGARETIHLLPAIDQGSWFSRVSHP